MNLADAIAARNRLVNAAKPAVDRFLLDHPYVLTELTPAVRTRVTLGAGVAYLLGWGLITPLDAAQWPRDLVQEIPSSLAPPTRR